MWGRYGRWSRRQRIEELLGIEPSGLADFSDLYNITPGTNTWIVRAKDPSKARPGEPEWMQGFGKLRRLRKETARIQARIHEAFEVIEPEDRA
jgi:hypothetical protein